METETFWLIAIFAAVVVLAKVLFCRHAQQRLGFSLRYLREAPQLLTAMAAKLACSARHVSGFTPAHIQRDLRSYSAAYNLVRIEYRDKKVIASLGGSFRRSATFRPGLGCSLDHWPDIQLNRLWVAAVTSDDSPWPAGEHTPHIRPPLQPLAERLVEEDNRAGLDTRALVVIHHGRLVAESYAASVGPSTPLLGWSMAKSLTAIMIGRMEALGLANLQCHNLFPQWRGDARSEITLQQLLQMCSGLRFDETYAPGHDATRMLFGTASTSEYALQSPLEHSPGCFFCYSSGTTNLLARWMHQQLGGTQRCIEFLYRELLQPLNMAHTLFETDASGVLVGSSYAYASGRDWARLGLLMLDNGRSVSTRLLREDWVQRAQAPNRSANEPGYGYQFWLNRNGSEGLRYPGLPADTYFMLGNHEQKLMICPSYDAVIVRIGWTAGEYPMQRQFARILNHLPGE